MTPNKQNFSRCLINPMDKDSVGSERASEVTENLTMLKYIICVYDPYSPFVQAFPDITARKEKAADWARVPEEERGIYFSFRAPESEEDYEDDDDKEEKARIKNENDELADMVTNAVVGYLKIVNSRKWAIIISLEQAIWEFVEKMMSPIEKVTSKEKDKDIMSAVQLKGKISKDLQTMEDDLCLLIAKFYGDDHKLIDATKVERPIRSESFIIQ